MATMTTGTTKTAVATAETLPPKLDSDDVRRVTDPASLGFDSTAALPAPEEITGQERALEAIEFALSMDDQNYNLYVSGMPGTGRSTSVQRAVAQAARRLPMPLDWCYAHNFDRPGEPLALSLPAGAALPFARAVDGCVLSCRRELRRAFSSESYRGQRAQVLKDLTAQRDQALEAVQEEALAHGFVLQITPAGVAIIPLKRARHIEHASATAGEQSLPAGGDYEPLTPAEFETLSPAEFETLSPAEFETLSPAERQHLGVEHDIVEEAIANAMPTLRAIEDEARGRILALDERIARQAVTPLVDAMAARYTDSHPIVEWLRRIQDDLVAHADVLRALAEDADKGERPADETAASGEASGGAEPGVKEHHAALLDADDDLRERPAAAVVLRRYRVNVFVSHPPQGAAPVIEEINPTYTNLVGHIEFGLRDGLPFTDHLMLKPGAFHRANGGYLILQARDLFIQPRAWEAVKRVLRFGLIALENGEDLAATPASASLRPEPVPVRVKVVLIGDPQTCSLLHALDPEFAELFKVRADFDGSMPRNPASERFYAEFAGDVARRAGLPPLDAGAVALLIEEGSRGAEDQQRLSAVLGDLRDLTLEAGAFASRDGASLTARAQVARALASRERRLSLVPDRLDDLMRDGTILMDTAGEVVGQINGLTVMAADGFAFGKPARITARTAPGRSGIVNIERETMMSGPAHSKGILVLGGYLAGRFAQDYPLSLAASICFEQVYGEIEGDSASSAELYALLSSLSDLPIKQSLAVTGSVNQRGEIQAIGGVNEKIEGFFKACASRGLTGEQGVLIPISNVRNLMLRQEVVEAIGAGTFHVYAVRSIDEGIALLTGVLAGVADAHGAFQEGSVNGRVCRTLRRFAQSMRQLGAAPAHQIDPGREPLK